MIIQDKTNIHISAKLKYRHHNGVWSEYVTGIITDGCYDFFLNNATLQQSSSNGSNLIIGKFATYTGILTNTAFGTSDSELNDKSTFDDLDVYESSDTPYVIDTTNNYCVNTKCTRNTITYSVGHSITTTNWCNRVFYFNRGLNGISICVVFNLQNKIQPNDYETLVEFEFAFDDTAKQGFDSIGRGFNRKIINRYITQNGVDYSNLLPGICYGQTNERYENITINGLLVRSGSGLFLPHIKNESCGTLSSMSVSSTDIPFNATLTNDLQGFPTQESEEQLNFSRRTPQEISINTEHRVAKYSVTIDDNKGYMLVFRGAYYLFDNGYMVDAYDDAITFELSVGFNEIAEEVNPEDIADKSKKLQYHRLVVDTADDSLKYKHGRYGIATQTGVNLQEPEIEWMQETTILIKTPNVLFDLGSVPKQCHKLNIYVASIDYEREVKQRDHDKIDETVITFKCCDELIDFKVKLYYVDNGFDDLSQYEPVRIVGELSQYFALHYFLRVRNGIGLLNAVKFNGIEKRTLLNCNIA